jgi:serine-type D-Ala-D-Ala carboxypeptidase (penicillin-binding protein 5/6)
MQSCRAETPAYNPRLFGLAMLRFIMLVALFICAAAHAAAPPPPPIVARSWLVGDVTSGQMLVAEKADERIEPASLTKLMTAYLVFAALHEKKLALEQTVPVSTRAWRAPGSRMFIEPRRPVTVDELIKGMEVQSGNDATIALAEAVAGSEEVFVQLMNREAERLGLKGSHFMNSTGLPDAQHYSTARDLYTLTVAVIRDFPEEYGRYYAMKEFRYNNIAQPNRNRLLWLDSSVDGVKTGHTEAAGYCLIASSKRGPRRLVSVLMGATSESGRAQESQKLLNWGFQFFDAVKLYGAGEAIRPIEVWKGASREVKAGLRKDLFVTVPKGESGKLKAELVSQQPLVAPVSADQRVGTLRVMLEDKPFAEYPVVALEAVPPAGIFGRAWDTLRLWIK